ncbi:alpha/beta fold hydrolase [Mycobacterium celatum]
MLWADPGWVTFVGELASFAPVILYDKRGTGLYDPVDSVPTLDGRADDLRSVLDAAGCNQVALLGFSEGGSISMLFAATYPQRVRALVLLATFASGVLDDDGSPGRTKWIELMTRVRSTIDHWGEGQTIDWAAPSLSGLGRNFGDVFACGV